MHTLPPHYEPYTDTYFLRSLHILQTDHLNPYVRAQLFIRNGPGTVAGITEAVHIIHTYSALVSHGGSIWALSDGDHYDSCEPIMTIVGPAQDILPLETMILGVLSGETTRVNDGTAPHLESIRDTVRSIVTVVSKRPIYWFGARHWRYDDDARISKAAFDGGASEASTDAGAATVGKKGIGTIPHALECIYGWKYGYARAVVEAAKAFDAIINPHVPRIALVDFNNKEIDDSLACARELGNHLSGVRVDTCGENTMQHASPISGHELDRYWSGTGVTVSGVYALRKALNENGFSHTHIILSSGFGEIHKIHAFLSAEKKLHIKLFDALGIGEVFPVRSVTMDIVSVGQTAQDMIPAAKIGRGYTPNARLKKIAVYSYEGHPDQSYVE